MSKTPALVGFHVPKNKTIYNTILTGMAAGANAQQFFICAPMNGGLADRISPEEATKILDLKKKEGVYTVIHGKYMYNFCRDKAWQVNSLVRELEVGDSIDCDVVIHQGKNVKDLKIDRATALKAFVDNLSKVIDKASEKGLKNRILLENSCQQGTELGYTLDELAKIYGMFTPERQKRLGFCLDTCHIFVAGELDVRQADAVTAWFNKFDRILGLEKLKVIHFNDSNKKFDAHSDNHHDLLVGHIGNPKHGGNSNGLKTLARLAHKNGIPMVMETPGETGMDDQIILVRSWISGQTEIEDAYREEYKIPEKKSQQPVPTRAVPARKLRIKLKKQT